MSRSLKFGRDGHSGGVPRSHTGAMVRRVDKKSAGLGNELGRYTASEGPRTGRAVCTTKSQPDIRVSGGDSPNIECS